MTDYLGATTLPVSATAQPIGDPLRQMLGDFLQAAIRTGCGAAWNQIGGGGNVVERVETNDPSDNTFVTSKLPCLAIYREERARKFTIDADDISHRESTVTALWVPPVAVQHWKARRESFYQGIEAVVMSAVRRGRTPGWRRLGDTDPRAAAEGSVVATSIGAMRPLHYGLTFEDIMITIEMPEAPPKKFPALKMSFQIWENLSESLSDYTNTAEGTYRTNGDEETDADVALPGSSV